jgi:hypothetical protein
VLKPLKDLIGAGDRLNAAGVGIIQNYNVFTKRIAAA